MIDRAQTARIHVLKSKLKLDDDSYRALLSGYGVASSTELSNTAAADVIRAMNALAERNGIDTGRIKRPLKYEHLGNRPGMASPKQLRLVDALWSGVSVQKTDEMRVAALNKFITRITGVAKMEWLEPHHIRSLVRAIKAMRQSVARHDCAEQGKAF
jgi:hypothetical protein